MWIGLVASTMWTRVRPRATARRLDGGVEILAPRRESDATVGRLTAAATARTPSKSPGEETANPASITSTPSASSAWAISTFSSGDRAMPGDCSPSLRVVSRIVILRFCTVCSFGLGRPAPGLIPTGPQAYLSCASVGRVRQMRRVSAISPLAGENQEQLDARTAGSSGYGHGCGVDGYV